MSARSRFFMAMIVLGTGLVAVSYSLAQVTGDFDENAILTPRRAPPDAGAAADRATPERPSTSKARLPTLAPKRLPKVEDEAAPVPLGSSARKEPAYDRTAEAPPQAPIIPKAPLPGAPPKELPPPTTGNGGKPAAASDAQATPKEPAVLPEERSAPKEPAALPEARLDGDDHRLPGAYDSFSPDAGTCDSDCTRRGLLSQCGPLQRLGIRVSGWLDQGFSVNGRHSSDGYNGVVTFNDRDREYQMNQLYLYVTREVDTRGCGMDWGGRVDLLYGTDARFAQADGLEDNWDQTERFYQLALPQFYLDVGVNNWTVRMGHFYKILGYEVVAAPNNFFYSHSYTMQYGEPFTYTGLLLIRKLSDRLSISGGFTRGIDQFDDTDGQDSLDFLGGATWTGPEGRLSLAVGITAGEQGPGNSTWIYSVVAKLKASERLEYVIQHDYGQTTDTTSADWYSIVQYLTLTINPCWALGLRYEWFGDPEGVRVSASGDGSLATMHDNPHVGPYQGDFQEISVGVNWKPTPRLTLRPELRWDWFNGTTEAGSQRPFAGDRNSQFLAACDMILTW